MAHTLAQFVSGSIKTHFGPKIFESFGPDYQPLVGGGSTSIR